MSYFQINFQKKLKKIFSIDKKYITEDVNNVRNNYKNLATPIMDKLL